MTDKSPLIDRAKTVKAMITEGYTVKQIAEMLKISSSTVRADLERAKYFEENPEAVKLYQAGKTYRKIAKLLQGFTRNKNACPRCGKPKNRLSRRCGECYRQDVERNRAAEEKRQKLPWTGRLKERMILQPGPVVCPDCGASKGKVIDVRDSDPETIRRRRECETCGRRFTTYEVIVRE